MFVEFMPGCRLDCDLGSVGCFDLEFAFVVYVCSFQLVTVTCLRFLVGLCLT